MFYENEIGSVILLLVQKGKISPGAERPSFMHDGISHLC